MLIIFDLDDTLIDTSGSITPVQLTQAFELLIAKGVIFPSSDKALELLLRLNETAPSAKHALEEFFEINSLSQEHLPELIHHVYEKISEETPVEAHEAALDTLQLLGETHKLALVTVGRENLQLLKLKKAGIHSQLFSKIIVTQEKDKKPHYKDLLGHFDMDPSDVVVCGDRISIDLTPAKELGCKTVQMRSGRGMHCRGNKSDVDFTISYLSELPKIIPQISNITSLIGNG